MTTPFTSAIPPDVQADFDAIAHSLAMGKPLDPELIRRIQKRAEAARQHDSAPSSTENFSTQVIRELRGPLDEEQERELTLAQREILHKGDRRLIDPDTGETYILVREEEYQRLRNK